MKLDDLRNIWKKREFTGRVSREGKSDDTAAKPIGGAASQGVHSIIPSTSSSEDDHVSHDDQFEQEGHQEHQNQSQTTAGVVDINRSEHAESIVVRPDDVDNATRPAGVVVIQLTNSAVDVDTPMLGMSLSEEAKSNSSKHVESLSEGIKPDESDETLSQGTKPDESLSGGQF